MMKKSNSRCEPSKRAIRAKNSSAFDAPTSTMAESVTISALKRSPYLAPRIFSTSRPSSAAVSFTVSMA